MRSLKMLVALTLIVALPGCVIGTGDTGPVDPGGLTVTASANAEAVLVGATVVLSVEATGGTAPYAVRWDQNAGPVDLTIDTPTATEITVGPLDAAGDYTFRVVVTDQDLRSVQKFVRVTVGMGAGVTLAADATSISEGTSATLTATTTEGSEPFTFVWTLQDGPTELDLSGDTGAKLVTPPLSPPGDYTFNVEATDSRGFSANATVTVTASSILTVNAAALAIVGTPADVSATVDISYSSADFAWSVMSGGATIADPAAATTTVTTSGDETVHLGLSVTVDDGSGGMFAVVRDVEVVSASTTAPRVRIETNYGDIVLELAGDAAPVHTANMLAYVDDGFYDGLLFHRNACTENAETGQCDPFVLQGGGYERVDGELVLKDPTRPTVVSEAPNGLTNAEVYSVALALRGGDPNSGSTQFFINLADNGFLDGQGFTVFAQVVEGTDVVDTIVAQDRTDSPILTGEVSLPVEDVIMQHVSRVAP